MIDTAPPPEVTDDAVRYVMLVVNGISSSGEITRADVVVAVSAAPPADRPPVITLETCPHTSLWFSSALVAQERSTPSARTQHAEHTHTPLRAQWAAFTPVIRIICFKIDAEKPRHRTFCVGLFGCSTF